MILRSKLQKLLAWGNSYSWLTYLSRQKNQHPLESKQWNQSLEFSSLWMQAFMMIMLLKLAILLPCSVSLLLATVNCMYSQYTMTEKDVNWTVIYAILYRRRGCSVRGKQMWRQKQLKVQKTKLIFRKPWFDSIPLQFNRNFCNIKPWSMFLQSRRSSSWLMNPN